MGISNRSGITIGNDGLPPGGTAGQVLTKLSDTDYDAYWAAGGAAGSFIKTDGTSTTTAPIPFAAGTSLQSSIIVDGVSTLNNLIGIDFRDGGVSYGTIGKTQGVFGVLSDDIFFGGVANFIYASGGNIAYNASGHIFSGPILGSTIALDGTGFNTSGIYFNSPTDLTREAVYSNALNELTVRALTTVNVNLNGSVVAAFTGTSITLTTAKLITAASSTSRASINYPAGTAPTSPVEGDRWADSTQKTEIAFIDGIKQARLGCLFTQTANKTVSNTTTETSIVGTGVGGLTLPANFFVAGKTIRITMSGVYSTVAVTGDTVTIKVKYGSTVLASKATTALVTGGTNLFWESEILVTCRTTGATGTVQISGGVRYQIAASAIVEDELNNGVATTTLDTTASSLLDVTITHSAADASNTVTSLVSAFEVLN